MLSIPYSSNICGIGNCINFLIPYLGHLYLLSSPLPQLVWFIGFIGLLKIIFWFLNFLSFKSLISALSLVPSV